MTVVTIVLLINFVLSVDCLKSLHHLVESQKISGFRGYVTVLKTPENKFGSLV